MTKDEQEALSRLYSDDIIRLLPLKSGAVAVFNNARDLCGIIPHEPLSREQAYWFQKLKAVWYPPKKPPAVDLEELGLV
jgi:hypothetical protein